MSLTKEYLYETTKFENTFNEDDFEDFVAQTDHTTPSGEPLPQLNASSGYCDHCGGFVEALEGYKINLSLEEGSWSIRMHIPCYEIKYKKLKKFI